tara:strand:+ start:413 stop:607 length:195 start_codon:yes stop_codon:yes gene_type:complete
MTTRIILHGLLAALIPVIPLLLGALLLFATGRWVAAIPFALIGLVPAAWAADRINAALNERWPE